MSRKPVPAHRGRRALLVALAVLVVTGVAVTGTVPPSSAAVPAPRGSSLGFSPSGFSLGFSPSGSSLSGSLPSVLPIGGQVRAVGVDQKAGLVWAAAVSDQNADSVTEFGEASQSVLATLTVPAGADALAVDQQTGLVWVGSDTTGHTGGAGKPARQVLTEITESSGATSTVDLTSASAGGRLIAVAADPGTASVFVLISNGRLIEVPEAAPALFSVVSTATVARPGAVALDPADGRIWITSLAGDSVSAFTEKGAPVPGLPRAIPVGADPGSIAVDPAAGLVWVGNLAAGTLTEIRETTGAIVDPAVSAGKGLAVVAVEPDQAQPGKGVVWTAGSFLPFTLEEFSEGNVPARLTSSGPADPGGVPEAIAVDSTNGQLYEGTSEGLTPFLPARPVLAAQSLTFWTHLAIPTIDTATNAIYFPPPVFTLSGAPSWLRIGRFSGIFQGVPPKRGKFTVTVTARNTLGMQSSAKTAVIVNVPPTFKSPTSTTFIAGRSSRFQVVADGIPKPTLQIGGATLPAGLSFSASGLISGVPAAGTEGNYLFFLAATNDPSGTIIVISDLTLHIVRGHAPKFTSPPMGRVRLRAGHHATVTIRASGVPAAVIAVRGKLPKGMTAKKGRPGAMLISGVPARSEAGHSFRLKVSAANVIGHVTETLVISID